MNFATWRNCQLLRNDIDDATWWGRDTREVRGEGGEGGAGESRIHFNMRQSLTFYYRLPCAGRIILTVAPVFCLLLHVAAHGPRHCDVGE